MDQHVAGQVLAEAGFSISSPIGSGMEGHVFRLDGDTVAKVWQTASTCHVRNLQAFYAALLDLRLPFMTPIMYEVMEIDGVTISVEAMLTGTPLLDSVSRLEPDPPGFAVDAVMQVLTALRTTELTPNTPSLALIGVDVQAGTPTDRLLAAARQKVARYGDQLRVVVPAFDTTWDAIQSGLQRVPAPERYAIHGDLCPPNILLGEDREVSAVLDWGFLSHAGDPAFETAIATCIFDMYGPHHRRIDDMLLQRCVTELGEDRDRLLVYRALYAVLTSNAYAEDGSDGHFAWCVDMLNRKDVRAAIGDVQHSPTRAFIAKENAPQR